MDYEAIGSAILFFTTHALYTLMLIEQHKERKEEKELLEFDAVCYTLLRERYIKEHGEEKAYDIFGDIELEANEILGN